jgi:hypothetical protein
LNVAVGLGANPNVGPRWWYGECLDALQGRLVGNLRSMRILVPKAFAGPFALDAGPIVTHIGEAGVFRRGFRINNRLGGRQIEHGKCGSA